jgi:prephenate dehydrogenase
LSASAGTGEIAIFGPGLIGGSVAMALRAKRPSLPITVWGRNPSALSDLLKRGLADRTETDPAAAVKNADLVVLCTPVGTMEQLALAFAPSLLSDALVTDAGSVKLPVVDRLKPILGQRFVGAHPMAGSERSGISAARANLFDSAPCIVTPDSDTPAAALAKVEEFWTSLGTRITRMTPWEHDRLVARISHLPHALAFALVNLVIDTLPPGAQNLAGGSFRDGTRVAMSDPALWTGILTENCTEVAAALREMSKLLNSMAAALGEEKADSLLDFLRRAKEHRDSLPLPPPEETP